MNRWIIFLKEDSSQDYKNKVDSFLKNFFSNENIVFYNQKLSLSSSDSFLSLGGDGTFLKATSCMPSASTLLSLHFGNFGFLPEFIAQDFPLNLSLLEKEPRFFGCLNILDKKYHFFNEAVFHPSTRTMCQIDFSDQITSLSMEGDGLILSTNYGSTAYSLSAGGPIVDPLLQTLILTPICSRSLLTRSLVLSNKIPLEISSQEDLTLTLDGYHQISLPKKTPVQIQPSEKIIFLYKNIQKSFFSKLKDKFYYGF